MLKAQFESMRDQQQKSLEKVEELVALTDDYSAFDLQVILEAYHIYESASQALLNTYAIKWFIKEVDKQKNLQGDKLDRMQKSFKSKIEQFGEIIDKLDEKVIQTNEGKQLLGSEFALFRMKLPDQIDEFNSHYTDFIDLIKLAVETDTEEVKEQAELQNNIVIQNAPEGNFEEGNQIRKLDAQSKDHMMKLEAKRLAQEKEREQALRQKAKDPNLSRFKYM